MAVLGIARWQRTRRRCRAALLVPRFFEGGAAKGHAEEAQRIVVDDLRSHLPTLFQALVQPIPVVIGADEAAWAEQVRKRLRATFVLHGRVAARAEGGWSVFPRLLTLAEDSVTHQDWFTRDQTPANPRFGPFVSQLPPQRGVRDEEFPLDFCRDLEALIRGMAGLLAEMVGESDQAIELLDEALNVARNSANHQIDALRASRALATANLGRLDEAIAFLRERAEGDDPSPHLLRTSSRLLLYKAWDLGEAGQRQRDEAIALLRKALEIRAGSATRHDDVQPLRDLGSGFRERGGTRGSRSAA